MTILILPLKDYLHSFISSFMDSCSKSDEDFSETSQYCLIIADQKAFIQRCRRCEVFRKVFQQFERATHYVLRKCVFSDQDSLLFNKQDNNLNES